MIDLARLKSGAMDQARSGKIRVDAFWKGEIGR
jgi:hypothetical protein